MAINPFSKLTEQELELLKLCGITSADQILKSTPESILADVQLAQQYFPDKQLTLTISQLQALHQACQNYIDEITPTPRINDLDIVNVGPTTGFRFQHKTAMPTKEQKKRHQKQILHSPVRDGHYIKNALASLGVLLLIIPTVSIFVLPLMMITDNLPDISLKVLAVLLFVVPVLPYLFISRSATCPVCHVRLFTFKNYSRNRAAHYIPGLGYNVATALHIIFLARYTCPGCGTPVKLLGKKGRSRHH